MTIATLGQNFQINSASEGNQHISWISALENGGFVATWTDVAAGLRKGQILDSFGEKVGGEFEVMAATNGFDGGQLVLANGQVVAFAVSGPAFGRILDASGQPTEAHVPHLVSPSGYVTTASLTGGGFVVAASVNNYVNIGVQAYDASGQKVGSQFTVSSGTFNEFVVKTVVSLSDGGYLLIYKPAGGGLVAQRFDASGGVVGTSYPISDLTTNIRWYDDVDAVRLDDGRVLVAWSQETGIGDGREIFARFLTPVGTTVEPAFVVNTTHGGSQIAPRLTLTSTGNIAVAWYQGDYGVAWSSGSNASIRFQLLDASGSAIGEEQALSDTAPGSRSLSVTPTADGGVFYVWRAFDSNGEGARGRHVSADGALASPELLINTATAGNQFGERVAANNNGIIVATFSDYGGADGSGAGVLAQAFSLNSAPTAVTLNPVVTALAEDADTSARIKVADIAVTDDGLGTNVLGLTGADAALFEIDAGALYLSAGAALDYESGKTSYAVAVTVDDAALGATPDATSTTFTLAVTDVAESAPAIIRVSSGVDGNAANGASSTRQTASFTADSRYMVFESAAGNLVEGDTNGVSDIFMLDTVTGSLTRVSTTDTGEQLSDRSFYGMISADGQFVSYHTSGPTGEVVVRKTLSTGETVTINGVSSSEHSVPTHSMSADGTVIAYMMANGAISRFDLETGIETPASVDDSGQVVGSLWNSPAISADGNLVAFYSDGPFVDGDSASYDVFIKNVGLGMTGPVIRASSNPSSPGQGGNDDSHNAYFSAGGRYFVFHTYATNLFAGDTGRTNDTVRYDVLTGAIELVSVAADGSFAEGPIGNTFGPEQTISADGRYVAFDSPATNLVADDGNGFKDVYVKDMVTGAIINVSRASDGTLANADSGRPAISADGRFVAFTSTATNLVAGDANGTSDVFLVDLDALGFWTASANNTAPTAVTLTPVVTSLAENADTATRIKIADIAVTDDGLGTNVLGLTGADAALFEIDAGALYLSAGAALDYESGKTSYAVAVTVDDAALGATPDASSTTFTLAVTDVDGRIVGTHRADVLRGTEEDEAIVGRRGDDVLRGGDGSDRLVGGGGADRLFGGEGADVFDFNAVSHSRAGINPVAALIDALGLDSARPMLSAYRDVILDFERGLDVIDLSTIDANALRVGDQAFHFIGERRFSDRAGELRIVESDRALLIEGDVDGDGWADLQFEVRGVVRLTGDDFVL
jgi:hypothetical protein